MRVATLLSKHHSSLKKHAHLVGQSEMMFREGDPNYMTGSYAGPNKKPWDAPDAVQNASLAKVEERQLQRNAQGIEDVFPGTIPTDKTAALPSPWDAPDRAPVGKASEGTHKIPATSVTMNELAPNIDSLENMKLAAFFSELIKISTNTEDLHQDISKYEQMKNKVHDLKGYGRSAAIGAAAMPFIRYADRLVAGPKNGKVFRGLRDAASASTSGALFGAALPALKDRADLSATKKHIQEKLNA